MRRALALTAPVVVALASVVVVVGCGTTAPATTAPAPAAAGTPAVDDDAAAAAAALDELLHRSGLEQKLGAAARVGPFFVENARRQAARLPPEDAPDPAALARFLAVAEHSAAPAFTREALVSSAKAALAALSPLVRARALAHFQDPRADRKAVVMAALATPAGQQRLARYLADVRAGEVDEERLLLVEGLIAASREVELAVVLAFDAATLFQRALAPVTPDALREPPEREAARREAFAASAKRQISMQLSYVYASLDVEDLRADVRYFSSPEGRAFAEASVGAVRTALDEAARRAEREVELAVETLEREQATTTPSTL